MKTPSGPDTYYMAKVSEYVDALKVAILSARDQAPSLLPVVVLTGPRSSEELVLRQWLHRHGALTLHHELSFHSDMELLRKAPEWAFSQNVLGSWLRVDLPRVLDSLQKTQSNDRIPRHLRAELAAISKDYVMWTDPDVVFKDSMDSCTLAKPQILSVGPEMRMGFPENYGVIYYNVSGYAAAFDGLIEWARQHKFRFDHDQNLFLGYWGTDVDTLPNGLNWKPYWGNSSMALPGHFDHERIRIVHFHGPKLMTAVCYFDEMEKDEPSGKASTPVNRLRKCGLGEAPSGEAGWLQALADLLEISYRQDRGHFYRDLLAEFISYLSVANEVPASMYETFS